MVLNIIYFTYRLHTEKCVFLCVKIKDYCLLFLRKNKKAWVLSTCRKTCYRKKKYTKGRRKVFARLFQKAADSKGRAFGRSPQGAKPLSLPRLRRGDQTIRWIVWSWGTLARSSPPSPDLYNSLKGNSFSDSLQENLISFS